MFRGRRGWKRRCELHTKEERLPLLNGIEERLAVLNIAECLFQIQVRRGRDHVGQMGPLYKGCAPRVGGGVVMMAAEATRQVLGGCGDRRMMGHCHDTASREIERPIGLGSLIRRTTLSRSVS